MISRATKLLLLGGIVLFYALVVFGNLSDADSNYQFVQHVLAMDTTFPGNHLMWRAISSPRMDEAFFAGIVAWEIATLALLCSRGWCGRCAGRRRSSTGQRAWR